MTCPSMEGGGLPSTLAGKGGEEREEIPWGRGKKKKETAYFTMPKKREIMRYLLAKGKSSFHEREEEKSGASL